ncbi:MAG TPA: carboxymuconolactone decarboxylase family protein [Jatrophihabitans sp.]|nr:carboxymuconolactone decarboxylase family protein [Jatrophihabitans sp.]
MGVFSQAGTFARVLPQARRNRTDLLRWLVHRPQLLAANGGYETALLMSGRMPSRLKVLAELKAGTLITCEYCIDIGSALAQCEGITEAQLLALPSFRTSSEFSEAEKLVLELAEAMTRIPTRIDAELRDRLTRQFSRAQIVELMSAIAWENHRGRLNQAFGVRPSGFADRMVCAVPEA